MENEQWGMTILKLIKGFGSLLTLHKYIILFLNYQTILIYFILIYTIDKNTPILYLQLEENH